MTAGVDQVHHLRLYRGLSKRYRPEEVVKAALPMTDFTDCPFTALQYGQGRSGVVLVADVPEDRAHEALWLDTEAKRFSVLGRFDRFLVGIIPAKELRMTLRRERVTTHPRRVKASVLAITIERLLSTSVRDGSVLPQDGSRGAESS